MKDAKTVHLVYPHGEAISCPDAIGRKLACALRSHYEVVLYDWDETGRIEPGPNDVLIGHPHPFPWTIFRRSLRDSRWRRVIAMIPYSHGDSGQMAWADATVARCDLLLAITGEFWFSGVASSIFAHWLPKMRHLDLAVDPVDFPFIKKSFNPAGRRKFLYVGNTARSKNTPFLARIAAAIPETKISWAGTGKAIPGVEPLGLLDFRSERAKDLVAEHDFLMTVGMSDANPATILEAMSWGLIPVCTPQSGYLQREGIVNLPLGNTARAAEIIARLQHLDESALHRMQAANRATIKDHFNWGRFSREVVEAIESTCSPPILPEPTTTKVKLAWAAAVSPHSFLHPGQIRKMMGAALKRTG